MMINLDEPQTTASYSSSDEEATNIFGLRTNKVKQYFGRQTEDLFIELDEPHKIYSPGDYVRGRVKLMLSKDTKTLYTGLHFNGQVRLGTGKQIVRTNLFQEDMILWGQPENHEPTIMGPQARQTEGTNRVSHNASFGWSKQVVSSNPRKPSQLPFAWRSSIMQAGQHVFEFEFQFPESSLPSTVDFGRGSISYFLRCEYQRPMTLTSRGRNVCKKSLTFLDYIDVGRIPRPKLRVIDSDAKSKRREGTGKISAIVELTKAGYLKGETIALNIQVQHIKPIKNMNGTIATLYRLSRFDSRDIAPQSFRKDLSQNISPLLVDPISLKYKVSPRLRIPADTFPTIMSAGPVSFRYFVEVVLDLNGRTTVWQAGTNSSQTDSSVSTLGHGGPSMETDALKREKGTYCVVFEVTIGTKDSTNYRDFMSLSHIVPSENESISQVSMFRPDVIDTSEHIPLPSACAQIIHQQPPRHVTATQSLKFPLSKAEIRSREAALMPSMPYEHLLQTGNQSQKFVNSEILLPELAQDVLTVELSDGVHVAECADLDWSIGRKSIAKENEGQPGSGQQASLSRRNAASGPSEEIHSMADLDLLEEGNDHNDHHHNKHLPSYQRGLRNDS